MDMKKNRRLLPILIVVAAALSCGKKGPPLPPYGDETFRIDDLEARQKGETVELKWSFPEVPSDISKKYSIVAVEIYRREVTGGKTEEEESTAEGESTAEEESTTEPAPPSRRLFKKEAALVAVIPEAELPGYRRGGSFVYEEELHGSEGRGTWEYALLLRSSKREKGVFSNIFPLTLSEPIPPPEEFRFTLQPKTVALTWKEPAGMEKEEETTIGYNVYRSSTAELDSSYGLNGEPVMEGNFVDDRVEYGKDYFYWVRIVEESGEEGVPAGPLEIRPIDIFPPEKPAGLRTIAEIEGIRLLWNPNEEEDLRGYHVYRKSGGSNRFDRLTAEPLKETPFLDTDAVPGKIYTYRITAVDGAEPPNESPFSEEETIHYPYMGGDAKK